MAPHLHADHLTPRSCFFITIATCGRRPSLGRLSESGVVRTPVGLEVAAVWERIGLFRPWVSTGPFVVMPDHVHGLLWWDGAPANRPTSVSIVVGGFKADATRGARAARALRSDQMLWQRGFASRPITTNASFERVARYIVNNPAAAWLKQVDASAAGIGMGLSPPPPDGGGSAYPDSGRTMQLSPPPDGGGSAGQR